MRFAGAVLAAGRSSRMGRPKPLLAWRGRSFLAGIVAKLERAGAGMIVLEAVPAALAREITAAVSSPTIGIGAGVDCHGQVLVLLSERKAPDNPAASEPPAKRKKSRRASQ